MSSGRDHDSFNFKCLLAGTALGLATVNPLILSGCLGFFVGTWWLSPDLDMKHSYPSQRFGFLSGLWTPYRMIVGHHRSLASHSPIFSTFFRCLYAAIPIILYCWYDGKLKLLYDVIQSQLFLAWYIGLELSTDVHLVLDLQYSVKRKIFHL